MPSKFNFGGFRCAAPGDLDELGDFVRDGDADRDQGVGFSRTYLVYDDLDDLIGYYTLLADAIMLAPSEGETLGPYRTAPAVKIARLGLRYDLQGRGDGKRILKHITAEVLDLAEKVGVRYITLDAVASKVSWYLARGFELNAISEQPSTEADLEAGERSMRFDLGRGDARPVISADAAP